MDNKTLNEYIDLFNNNKNIEIDILKHLDIYNFLLELKMYREIGTLNEIYELKDKYRTIKFAHDLLTSINNRLEKSNGEMADELVKLKGLMR